MKFILSIRRLLSNIYRFFFPISNVTMFKRMGVDIGEGCQIMNEVMIDYSHYWHIKLGNNVRLAPRVHILAHDASTKAFLNYTKIGKVEIGDNVFVGAGSIILPGVKIGKDSIIGAGSVVTKDIEENSLAVGNPCIKIGNTSDYILKQKQLMNKYPIFDETYTLRKGITNNKMKEMNDKMVDRFGFIE